CLNDNRKYAKEIDVTDLVSKIVAMVKDLERNDMTLIQYADACRKSSGSKARDPRESGISKYYGLVKDLKRDELQRLLQDLVLHKILMEVCKEKGGFPTSYIYVGPEGRKALDPGRTGFRW